MTETEKQGESIGEIERRRAAEERRRFAAHSLQRHFSSHPDCVIVCSMKDGKISADVTPAESIGQVLFMARVLQKYVDDTFDQLIAQMRESHKPESEAT